MKAKKDRQTNRWKCDLNSGVLSLKYVQTILADGPTDKSIFNFYNPHLEYKALLT